jgi:inorganic pyrophosphatase
MSLTNLPAGKEPPHDIYVYVEIPAGIPHIKYELDKDSELLFVDRFPMTTMVYPAHYGFINHTLDQDGDPVDALVYTDMAVTPGCVVRCRPVGVLFTEDESGGDAKIICVPHKKLDPRFEHIKNHTDLPEMFIRQVEDFFGNHKNLEAGKWVKVKEWGDAKAAMEVITKDIAAARE